MLMPAPTYLFIDYENLQNIRLTDLNRENLHVLIFVGKNQHAIPFGLVTDAQLFGDRLEWIKIEREGRNNLDFHICFVMGQLDTKLDKNAAFVVLSRDKGFDAVVQYINGRGRPCSRLESVGPVLPPPSIESLLQAAAEPVDPADLPPLTEEDLERVINRITRMQRRNRPSRARSLRNFLEDFGRDVGLPQPGDIIFRELVTCGFILEGEGDRVSYAGIS